MTNSNPSEEGEVDLPPSTVPATTQLHLLNLHDDPDWNGRFQAALIDIVVACGRFMDLRLLDGLTVGFDYDAALASVDLGYESSIAKGYTNSGGLVGVGKILRVKREGAMKAHVVLDANYLGGLVEPDGEEFWPTANIVAHELAHVAVTAWFEEHSPGVMLAPYSGDWATFALRDTAHTIWEEYAACRLSSPISRGEYETARYSESLALSLKGAVNRARECIKAYRTHHDVSQLLVETTRAIAEPLKIAAYLIGHTDGVGDQREIGEICQEAGESELLKHLAPLRQSLQQAWESRHSWNGLEGVDPIVRVILAALTEAGAYVTLRDDPPGSRVDVPFSAETMPNGEVDMIKIQLQKIFGLEAIAAKELK